MMQIFHAIASLFVAIVLLTWLGNVLCRLIFNLTGLRDATAEDTPPAHNAGRVIGTLERTILAVGVVTQRWEILAAVIALKTVARFSQLDKREFAEYFLVGSLFSVFWAMLIASGWEIYDHEMGLGARAQVINMLGFEAPKTGSASAGLSLDDQAKR